MIYVVQTASLDRGGRKLALQCGFMLSRLHERLGRLRIYLAISLVAALVMAVSGGWFLAGRTLAPMLHIGQMLQEIRSSSLARRLPARPVKDELARLTMAINSMLDELEEAFHRTKSFTADVAHELRTPLSTLRCEMEVALTRERNADEYQTVVESALTHTKKLSKVIDNLLFLAQTDSSASPPDDAEVDLPPLLEELAESYGLIAEGKGVDLSVDIAPSIVLHGNREWLKIMFANLLDNAVKCTQAGGCVSLKAASLGDHIQVQVADTGVGIPQQEQQRIFDRFYRADKSRSRDTGGAGLGLSIAQRIAQLHQGQIIVRSRLGEGSTFEVLLPMQNRRHEL